MLQRKEAIQLIIGKVADFVNDNPIYTWFGFNMNKKGNVLCIVDKYGQFENGCSIDFTEESMTLKGVEEMVQEMKVFIRVQVELYLSKKRILRVIPKIEEDIKNFREYIVEFGKK